MKQFLLVILLVNAMYMGAQVTIHLRVPPAAQQNVRAIEQDFYPVLQALEMPSPSQYARPAAAERQTRKSGQDSLVTLGLAVQPQMATNFNGNLYNFRTPNDNDLAVSNDGQLVSVTNSVIYFYNANEGKFLRSTSLASFGNPLGFTESKYDPKVVYDPVEDRFVMVFLNGNLDSTSQIIVAFSATNDPLGNWNLYALSGNPIDNDTWSDFPNIALSTDELFLTFNTFTNGSVNNSGFVEATIWQIDKYRGYAGDSLHTKYYAGLNDNGQSFFNITPIMGGAGLYGPEMHFVSNRNLSASNDTFFVFTIDNTIANNGQLQVTTLRANQHYGLPPGGQMPGTDTLDCNDARILGGFFAHDVLHFVGNTKIEATDRAGIYHGQITDLGTPNADLQLNLLGIDTLDLGYPNIAYVGMGAGDNSAILVTNYSGETTFPTSAALHYDGRHYSGLTQIKEGISSVDVLTSTQERWGDYADVQPKYNEPGVVWSATSYARSNAHFTWIASHVRPFGVTAPVSQPINTTVAPNPASQQALLTFRLANPTRVRIALYDMKGQEVALLLADNLPVGTHQFSCQVSSLAAGLYLLEGRSASDELLFQEKIIKK